MRGSLDGIDHGTLDCAVGMFASLAERSPCAKSADGSLCLRHAQRARIGAIADPRSVHRRGARAGNPIRSGTGARRRLAQPDGADKDDRRRGQSFCRCTEDRRTQRPSHLRARLGFFNGPWRAIADEHELVVRDLPFETEKLLYKLIWHERLHTHPAHQWFRSLVTSVCGMPEETTAAEVALQHAYAHN